MSQIASADDNSAGAAPAATPVATVVAPSNRNMSNAEANYISRAETHRHDDWFGNRN